MDLSLAADSYNNTYLNQQNHQHYRQYQQQQQQQQQFQHIQQHQPHAQHYQFHSSHNPQALTLAPPAGKGFHDLESLEHASASSSLGFGHLGASSSYQSEYGLYMPGSASGPSPAVAPPTSNNRYISSYSSSQSWPRNSVNATNLHGNALYSNYSPVKAAEATIYMSSGTFTPVDVHSAMQSASFHGFAPQEVQRSQRSQHLWDNCFPPGVEPEPNPASSGAMLQTHLPVQMQTSQLQQPQLQQQQIQQYPQQLVHPHPHAPPYPHTHPHLPLNMQTYHPQQQQQQRTPFGFNMRTGRASEKMRPKRKAAKESSKQVPVVKSTSTDETRTGTEKGPGWCSVCKRDCVTEVALKQHLEGKGHRKQVERQKARSELTVKTADEDKGVATMLEKVWMKVTMMSKPSRTGRQKRKTKDEGKENDVEPIDGEGNAEDQPQKKRARAVKSSNANKPVEVIRCDLCNVECNSKAVLEVHLGGKKHAARLKKAQEAAVTASAEQPGLVPQ